MSRLILDQESGQWINEKFMHLAEIINDFDPRLRLLWIPEGQRTAGDIYPYAVGHFQNEFTEPHIILFVMEEELDERLLAKLFQMRKDAQDPFAAVQALQLAKDLIREKELAEHQEEMHDRAKVMWKSRLHTFRMNGRKYDL